MSLLIRKLDLTCVTDLKNAFPVMFQLRTHLDFKKFARLVEHMRIENYELWAAFEGEQIVGLASSRVYTDLVRGPHIYIDDLVTDQTARSKGIGAELLKQVERDSKSKGLDLLRLCCAIENERGMKFYKKEGWKERSFALVKRLHP